MNIEKVSSLGFDGGLFHIFAELSYVRSHVLKKLFVNHCKKQNKKTKKTLYQQFPSMQSALLW